MAKDETLIVEPEKVEIDYSAYNLDQLLEAVGKAWEAKDLKLMATLSKLHGKKEVEVEKAKRDALQAELAKVTDELLARFMELTGELADNHMLDGAEGIWFAYDLGEIDAKGTNPTLRLVKSKRTPSDGGTSTGKSSYIASPEKSSDLLAKVGDHVMFAEDTLVTIDKKEQTIAAGTTFKNAYEHSTNGGWRNRCRMALLKEAGVIT